VERFADQPLGARPHIAVLSSFKVGNFVVTTPLLRGLKEKYPDATLDFFGSEVTRDFETHCPWIDFRASLHGAASRPLEAFGRVVAERKRAAGPYALAINCDGFSDLNLAATGLINPRYVVGGTLSADLQARLAPGDLPQHRMLVDDDWNSPEFLRRYTGVLDSNYIAELFCRMAWVDTEFDRLELPSAPPNFDVPDVLVHATTTRSAKMWPLDSWTAVLAWCDARGLSTGLIGSAPKAQQALYNAGELEELLLERTALQDLRGQTPLLQLAGVLRVTRVLITVDAGPLHVAAAVGCPTVAIFGTDASGVGASPRDLWAPRRPFVAVTLSGETCTVCRDHQFRNDDCLVGGHPCMRGVSPESVIGALSTALGMAPVAPAAGAD